MVTDDNETGSTAPAKVPTTLRALIVLEKVAEAGVPVTPTEVNQSLKLTKATIHRIFASLEEEGFIQRDIDGRSYAASSRLRNLAFGVVSSVRLRSARRTAFVDHSSVNPTAAARSSAWNLLTQAP